MFEVWTGGERLTEISEESIPAIIGCFVCFVDKPSRTVILW